MDFVRSYFGKNEHLTSTDLEKKWGQKGSTGQRFICSELTSYKIHILEHELELEDIKPTKMTTIFSQQFFSQQFLGK